MYGPFGHNLFMLQTAFTMPDTGVNGLFYGNKGPKEYKTNKQQIYGPFGHNLFMPKTTFLHGGKCTILWQ